MKNFFLRRVYEAKDCSVVGAPKGQWKSSTFVSGPFTIEVGINNCPHPDHPLPIVQNEHVAVGVGGKIHMELHHSLSTTSIVGPIVELICWANNSGGGDDELMRKCRAHIDIHAVAVGMALSRQFLGTEVGEDIGRVSPGGPWTRVGNKKVFVNREVRCTQTRIARQVCSWMQGRLPNQSFAEAGVLRWLLRAWQETDPTYRFMALFIPLEMVLSGYKGPRVVPKAELQHIRRIINNSGDPDRLSLIAVLNDVSSAMRPSLSSRFRAMAEELFIATAEADTASFERFNQIRNDLVHRGMEPTSNVGSVTEVDVGMLMDLTERYVVARVFGVGPLRVER